jgi:hypothetical protein
MLCPRPFDSRGTLYSPHAKPEANGRAEPSILARTTNGNERTIIGFDINHVPLHPK